MSKIKIRAWNPVIREMIYDISEINTGNNIITEMESGVLRVKFQDSYGCWQSAPTMQFTGLYDKDGKEIYEEDILSNGQHIDWIVFFDEASFKVRHTLQPISQQWVLDRDMAFSRKIVGNIYEKLELLR